VNAILIDASAETIAAEIMEGNQILESVFHGISNGAPRLKFRCAKSLILLSEKRPALLYSKMAEILNLLESKNQILKWNAIIVLGNLASADFEGGIDGVLQRMYAFLSCGELITANNAIAALGKIGRAIPGKRAEIIAQLLRIERLQFDTEECRNIAIGKAILVLEELLDCSKPNKKTVEFAQRQVDNRRPATVKKAKKLLRRLDHT
jgi:hypothetical protein